MATPRPLATVERAVRILDALAAENRELGNNEIARLAEVNLSTASRMLHTLAAAGLVRRSPDTGRYRLGPRMVELGNAALTGIDLRTTARHHLIELVTQTGETATLSVPSEQGVVTVDFERNRSAVLTIAEVGRRAVLHATATGKVYLAYGGQLPKGKLDAYTAQTLTTRPALSAEINRVREQGWAEAIGERDAELNAVAVPILDSLGQLTGVLGLQGPATRFGARARRQAVKLLDEHARAIVAGRPRPRGLSSRENSRPTAGAKTDLGGLASANANHVGTG